MSDSLGLWLIDAPPGRGKFFRRVERLARECQELAERGREREQVRGLCGLVD
jgi:hypothetical protein